MPELGGGVFFFGVIRAMPKLKSFFVLMSSFSRTGAVAVEQESDRSVDAGPNGPRFKRESRPTHNKRPKRPKPTKRPKKGK